MRRNKFSLIALVMSLVALLTFGLASCGENVKPTPAPDNKVTVTWYNGTEELKTEKVEKGSTLESWTPVVEGKTFMAWYAEASKSTLFDFTKPVNEDTDIFAGFKAGYVEDTTEWYIIGQGAGTLSKSSWNLEDPSADLKLVKQEVADKNIFKLENVVLYENDLLQIHAHGTWDNQHGVGYFKGYEEATSEEDANLRGYVKADDVTYFKANKGFGDTPKGWDAIVVTSGIYTLELETFPGSGDYDEVRFTKTAEAPVIEVTHEMYIRGTISSWGEDLADWKLKANSDNTVFDMFFTVEEDGAEIKVHNKISDAWINNAGDTVDYTDGGNILLNKGDYAIRYTVEGDKIEIQKLGYYVVGTFVDAEDNDVNFSVKNGVTPELTLTEGTATLTLEVTDVSARGGYSWLAQQNKGISAYKVVYGCELGIRDWFADTEHNDDNFYPQEAGSYTLTFTKTAEGHTITLVKAA